ncbi:unnamed protein product [Dibothriocephalus latus]|uniref:Actin-related protein 10 n=1 Tax=Dibothriocephalus latus TaxID=60516 RepID=A0A3P7NSB2_DIBLA|nr:unnamed protein product [Dibothriocephalus latus]
MAHNSQILCQYWPDASAVSSVIQSSGGGGGAGHDRRTLTDLYYPVGQWQLIENIVCIGGTCMTPGFLHRLSEEIKISLELPRYASLAALKDSVKFHKPPSKANYTAWLGGSIFGALESLPGRSYSRTKYLEQKTIPDWSLIWETDTTENRDYIHTR